MKKPDFLIKRLTDFTDKHRQINCRCVNLLKLAIQGKRKMADKSEKKKGSKKQNQSKEIK